MNRKMCNYHLRGACRHPSSPGRSCEGCNPQCLYYLNYKPKK